MHQGEFVQAHLAPPLGELSSKARLRGAARSHGYRKTKANPYNPPLPPLGVVLRAANQDNNDCRWQSYLCFVPRSGKGGVVSIFDLLPFNEPHPLSQAVRPASSPTGEPRGMVRICLGFYKDVSTCRNPSAAAAAAQLCMKRLHLLNLSGVPRKGLFCFGLGKRATNIEGISD